MEKETKNLTGSDCSFDQPWLSHRWTPRVLEFPVSAHFVIEATFLALNCQTRSLAQQSREEEFKGQNDDVGG